jgi:hypothetical protein
MPIGFLIGIGGGLTSALLFYSAARGSAALGTMLLLLTPLPSLLAGLGWGWLPAAAAAAAGSIAMSIAANVPFAVGYGLALGLPAVIVPYLAYMSRPDPQDQSRREWYPAGRLVAAIALYGGALPVLVLPLIGGSYDGLRPPMSELLRAMSAHAPELGLKPLDDQQIEALAAFVVAMLPGAFAAYWVAIFTLNTYLAGRIARASGRLVRDWPDLPQLAFPPGFPLLTAIAIAATFAPGIVGVAGTSFSGALLFAYLLGGLALMHLLARTRAPWLLWGVYAGLILFGPYAALILMLAGLLEPVLRLARRFGTPPPPTI